MTLTTVPDTSPRSTYRYRTFREAKREGTAPETRQAAEEDRAASEEAEAQPVQAAAYDPPALILAD